MNASRNVTLVLRGDEKVLPNVEDEHVRAALDPQREGEQLRDLSCFMACVKEDIDQSLEWGLS